MEILNSYFESAHTVQYVANLYELISNDCQDRDASLWRKSGETEFLQGQALEQNNSSFGHAVYSPISSLAGKMLVFIAS